jgi:hypothetical protein
MIKLTMQREIKPRFWRILMMMMMIGGRHDTMQGAIIA